jgi:hypothetical protein
MAERDIQETIRLEAAARGIALYRNNVGALLDQNGRLVRYGLCNDSKALNEKIKSGDLIGIRPVIITPDMVGRKIGQFISRECKAPGWVFSGTAREIAQQTWIDIVRGFGGDAGFSSGPGSF